MYGTSSCMRTSGGRLNLGLAQPRVRYSQSASYRLQSGKPARRSHSHFAPSFSSFPPHSLPLSSFTYVQEREEKKEGGNEECTYMRPAVRPAGRFTRKAKARQSRAGRRQPSPALKRAYDTHRHAFTLVRSQTCLNSFSLSPFPTLPPCPLSLY